MIAPERLEVFNKLKAEFPPTNKKGGVLWTSFRNPKWRNAYIEWEIAKDFITHNITTTFTSLNARRGDLSGAIRRYYPEGLYGIQQTFGVNAKKRNPAGYWKRPEARQEILDQSRGILVEHGNFSGDLLQEIKRSDLLHGTRDYPGGMNGLRQDLGLEPAGSKVEERRGKKYWTEERIREAALKLYQQHGKLTTSILVAQEGGLVSAITGRYPGKLLGLRQDLHIDEARKPKKFWKDPANIEIEAREFVDTFGRISQNLMIAKERADLWSAIIRYYPGRIKALKEKLGLVEPAVTISPEEANLDLDKLLE